MYLGNYIINRNLFKFNEHVFLFIYSLINIIQDVKVHEETL